MFDLYLISILDSIIGVSVVFTILGLAATIVWIVCVVLNTDIDQESPSLYEEKCLKTNNTLIKIMKPFVWVGIVCLALATFLPSTKQGYVIYGVGSTIEYLQSSDKAKELPDKAVDALSRYLDECGQQDSSEPEE